MGVVVVHTLLHSKQEMIEQVAAQVKFPETVMMMLVVAHIYAKLAAQTLPRI